MQAQSVTTLEEHLAALPHRDLRAVVTRLGLRARGQHRKESWRAVAVAAWRDPVVRAHLLAKLSPEARQTAARLARAGAMPAALFLAEHGPLRRAGPGRAWSPPPWEQPATVAEELYYAGLLCPLDPPAIGRARRIAIPLEVRPALLAALPAASVGEPACPADSADPAVLLLHDATQMLLLLAAEPGRPLLHDRWLSAARLTRLNARLLRPDPDPITTHKRSPRLRFLLYLLRAAALWADGEVTPAGHAWLATPPFGQIVTLWQAWRTAPSSLRQAYEDAPWPAPSPWPDPLLEQLTLRPEPVAAAALADALWGQTPLAV
jgi:hypothetical protein